MEKKRRKNETQRSQQPSAPDLLTQHEQDRLLIATTTALAPTAPTEMELRAVIAFARGARASQALLENVLDGKLVPAGVKDGDIGFRTVDGTVTSDVGAKLHDAIAVIKREAKPAIPIESVIAGTCDVDKLLSTSEIARLRIVHDWATDHCSLQDVTVTSFLELAADCRREHAQLHALLEGIMLPIPDADGRVEFLLSSERMSALELKRYRKGLRRLPG